MGNVRLGLNLEYVRHADKSFEWAVECAAEMGYAYVEPMVHWGRELLSAAGYFHSVSLLDDPLRVRRACERHGVGISGLSSHAPLCKPDVSLDYLRQAVRFAAECGAPIVVTDDGPKPTWTTADEDHALMRYVLAETVATAEPRNVTVALETHDQYTNRPDRLAKTLGLVDSPSLAINFDTGNAYLSENDPGEWLEQIIGRVVNVHAKDIPADVAAAMRGKIKGMLGCACGEGVLDWPRIVDTCLAAPQDLVLSVECGSIDDAHKSYEYLSGLLAERSSASS
jgi:sugar phosphate isomerase/epimerase